VVGVRDHTDAHLADAGRLALAGRARLVVVHAHGRLAAADRLRLEHGLAGVVSALRTAGVQADYELQAGRPASVLVGVARETGAELLVIGSSPPRRWRRRIGGLARALGRRAPCRVVLAAA
jgi:nucleotide-binding universal stress UspA family protein